jgi:hypothetical protein
LERLKRVFFEGNPSRARYSDFRPGGRIVELGEADLRNSIEQHLAARRLAHRGTTDAETARMQTEKAIRR